MTGEDRANKIEALKKKIGESHEIANTCIDKSTNALELMLKTLNVTATILQEYVAYTKEIENIMSGLNANDDIRNAFNVLNSRFNTELHSNISKQLGQIENPDIKKRIMESIKPN
jgi:hypothetical protein